MFEDAVASLPAGYSVRAPSEDDIPAILALLDEFELAENGQPAGYTAEDIRDGWSHLEPATDAWFIAAPSGAIAGYGEMTDFGSGRLVADGYVHPRHTGLGLGTALVRLTECRARELAGRIPAGVRVVLENNVVATSRAACELLEREGYAHVRTFYQMRIDLDGPPRVTAWPEGISVRAFVPGQDERATYETVEVAFADHWGHVPRPYEEWIERTNRPGFDPSLWLLAEDGDQLAGVALCRLRAEEGWVSTLAVLRGWRKRGLGMALLTHAFDAFYRRGISRIGLGTDAASLTGATRLYERAGMRVTAQAACYYKELRPGLDKATRTLDE